MAPRRITGSATGFVQVFNPITSPSASFTNSNFARSDTGIVVGGGVQFSLGRFRVSPEARYTHWTSAPSNGVAGVTGSQQQVESPKLLEAPGEVCERLAPVVVWQ